MSGYRQSGYDPNYYERAGRPLRPFNWVQWSGVALLGVGAVALVASIGGALDIAALQRFRHVPAIIPILLGNALINSRREPVIDPAPELAAARKRWALITVAICVVVLGAATVIEFTGAN